MDPGDPELEGEQLEDVEDNISDEEFEEGAEEEE